MKSDGFLTLLVSLWHCADAGRRAELLECLRNNARHPCIARIVVFAESGARALVDEVAAESIEVIDQEGYPSFATFFDFANRNLRGQVVAIANADIFFDESLERLRDHDFDGGVLALTRHNVRPSVGWNGRVWERNYGSQDAWIFRAPVPPIRNDLRMGWFGCDGRLARELQQAGVRVTNPSLDIKAWHLHAAREPVTDLFTHPKSYFPATVDPQTWHQYGLRCLPIEPLGRWKIYTCYSRSHEEMFRRWFLGTMRDDFDVVARRLDQECLTAEYMADGWTETVLRKIPLILEAIDAHEENGFFLFSDVDVQWFGPVQGRLRRLLAEQPNVDLFFQADAWKNPDGVGNVCTGFFVCKGNVRTRAFWTLVGEIMRRVGCGDQRSAQEVLRLETILGLRVGYLPPEFWGPGSLQNSPSRWEPGMALVPPMDILVHHANWTVGTANKVEQLECVAGLVRRRAGDRDLSSGPPLPAIDQWQLTAGAAPRSPSRRASHSGRPFHEMLRFKQRPERLPGSFWAVVVAPAEGDGTSRRGVAGRDVARIVRRHGLKLAVIDVTRDRSAAGGGLEDADLVIEPEPIAGDRSVDRAALLALALSALPPECDKIAWLDPSPPPALDAWLEMAVALLERYEAWHFAPGDRDADPGDARGARGVPFKSVEFGPAQIRADLAVAGATGMSWVARRRLLESSGFAAPPPDRGPSVDGSPADDGAAGSRETGWRRLWNGLVADRARRVAALRHSVRRRRPP